MIVDKNQEIEVSKIDQLLKVAEELTNRMLMTSMSMTKQSKGDTKKTKGSKRKSSIESADNS